VSGSAGICRLSRGNLALGQCGRDARTTAAGRRYEFTTLVAEC